MPGLGLRDLGGTGLKVSVIGFGASPLGSVFRPVSVEDAVASVHEAIRLGINFFDVSPFYGNTLAEKALGVALKSLPVSRDNYVLSTKCGRYGDHFDFTAERVIKSVDESLERLNVSYVDLIICHDIEFGSIDQVVTETIPALQKLKETGKVKFIGVSGLPLKIFSSVLDRVPPGTVDIVLSYCHNTLTDATLEEYIPYLKSKDVGIISASPLSMGLLINDGPPVWHPAPDKLKAACAAAAEHCRNKGVNISKVALQYALRNADISITLIGMSSVEEVRENVEAATELLEGCEIDAVLLGELANIFEPVKNLTWPSGRAENS